MAAFRIFNDKENVILAKHCDRVPVKSSKLTKNNVHPIRRVPLGTVCTKLKKPKATIKEEQKENEAPSNKTEYLELLSTKETDKTVQEDEKENRNCNEEQYLFNDLICYKEYGRDFSSYLYQLEMKLTWPKENYMLKQKHINERMRSILVDWLATITLEYKLNEHTLHLSIYYIDSFLSYMSVVRDKFQLLGVTAMMLAVKVEEVQMIGIEEWVHLTANSYTKSQILRMEQLLLKVLQFDVNPPTMITFVRNMCFTYCLDKRTLYMAMYLSELILLESDYLKFLPSKLAAGAVILARYVLGKENPWFEGIEISTGYTFEELRPVITRQYQILEESSAKEQAIPNKYKMEKFGKVATIIPRILVLGGYAVEV